MSILSPYLVDDKDWALEQEEQAREFLHRGDYDTVGNYLQELAHNFFVERALNLRDEFRSYILKKFDKTRGDVESFEGAEGFWTEAHDWEGNTLPIFIVFPDL